jgi:hypothetical protein
MVEINVAIPISHLECFFYTITMVDISVAIPISHVECFFYTITMMDINVNIQHSGVVFQKFQDGQYKIVDIAESRCLRFTIEVNSLKGLRVKPELLKVQRHAAGHGLANHTIHITLYIYNAESLNRRACLN